jgi:MscS family membrane protein
MNLEIVSARDKFWFHPLIALRYETNSGQLRSVVNDIETLLASYPSVDHESIHVQFLRFGSSSLDVDVFAYIFARDWNHFLKIQQELLFRVMEIVQQAGVRLALPSQTVYLAPRSVIAGGGAVEESAPDTSPSLKIAAGKPR